MNNENKRKNSPEYERQQFFNFFEELCWLLDSNKDINFKSASKYLREYRNVLVHWPNINNDSLQHAAGYNLIGILPSLLKDEEIFQTNSELVQFANEVLSLHIPRWEKKSRNEIIGLIICEVEDANKQRLSELTKWSQNIMNNKNAIREYQKKAKTTGNMFSWNETIQQLVGRENE